MTGHKSATRFSLAREVRRRNRVWFESRGK